MSVAMMDVPAVNAGCGGAPLDTFAFAGGDVVQITPCSAGFASASSLLDDLTTMWEGAAAASAAKAPTATAAAVANENETETGAVWGGGLRAGASASPVAADADSTPTTKAPTVYNGSGCPGLTAPWGTTTTVTTGDDKPAAAATGPLSFNTARIVCAVFAVITAIAVLDLSAAAATTALSATAAPAAAAAAPAMRFVWAAGWITAVSTGLGVVPFLVAGDIKKFWMGASNAIACGMMAAASAGLLLEAVHVQEEHHMAAWGGAWVRAVVGAVAGVGFILGTKAVLDQYEDLKFSGFSGASANKMLLIMAVMTLHSLAEGVGIGVSFAGATGSQFGMVISSTLAIHNVPEGLAICLVLIPRGVGPLEASMWAIFSSLPQPLMAVPAYASVQAFLPFLPVGLGFAAGAMLYVAVFELLPEALEDVPKATALPVAAVAATVMASVQFLLH